MGFRTRPAPVGMKGPRQDGGRRTFRGSAGGRDNLKQPRRSTRLGFERTAGKLQSPWSSGAACESAGCRGARLLVEEQPRRVERKETGSGLAIKSRHDLVHEG